ncbi:MAG: hypothetical protein ING84_13365 [Cytophagales bacterium]|nr:hypothetical protein [Cytophagales bacterium]MCA6367480.1 hypothetical protein [Cytophagales bacterium]MCA6371896.1 hypothetical protein [Cytophagales bacterium]MCA6376773.1 hypothetical protein [Cytophagales bacterium]MCA6383018.1 hypothetical protein [Cytophagales bacterium]
MRSLLLFCLLVVLTIPVIGQNRALIDSLKLKLKETSTDQQFELLNSIGWEYRFAKPDSTIYYCEQAYELGKIGKLKTNLAKPLNFLAVAYNYLGNLSKAYDLGQEAIRVATIQQDSNQIAYGNNNIGRLLFEQGILSKSLPYFINAQKIFTSTGDQSGIAYTKQSLAVLYLAQQDFAKAEQALLGALATRLLLKKVRDISSAYTQLGTLYQKMDDLEKSNFYFLKSDSVYQTIDDAINLARTKVLLAENYLRQGRISEARNIGEKGFAFIEKSGNVRRLPEAHLLMGRIYLAEKKYGHARQQFSSALQLSKSSQQSALQLESYYLLAQVSKMLNNRQEEILNMNQYLILKDSVEDLELARKVERLQFELQIESQEKENELLKIRQTQTETLVSRQRLANILSVLVIVFLSILAVLYWQIGKRRKMLNDKLATQNDQIDSHQHEIDIKNEALSKRNQQLSDINHEKDTIMSIVAHDLKAPLNRISGLAYLLEKEGPLNVNQMTYIQMIRDSTKSGARLIADLLDAHAMEENSNAPSYQDFDLAKLLSDSILYFQVVALEKDIRLEKTLPSTALFTSDPSYINRIVENLVSNAIKFSKVGSSVFLECRIESKNAIIKVRDQRPGFTDTDRLSLYKKFKKLSAKPTSSESSNGLGLAIVKTLIDRLGGTIELISSEGKGSEFVVSIPYIETKS